MKINFFMSSYRPYKAPNKCFFSFSNNRLLHVRLKTDRIDAETISQYRKHFRLQVGSISVERLWYFPYYSDDFNLRKDDFILIGRNVAVEYIV